MNRTCPQCGKDTLKEVRDVDGNLKPVSRLLELQGGRSTGSSEMTPEQRHERARKANQARNAKLTAKQRRELTRLAAHRLWETCACGCKGRLGGERDRYGRLRRYLNGHNRATMIRKGRSQSRLTADDFLLALGQSSKR